VILEFKEMRLKPELIEALRRVGFVNATEVQDEAIPILLQGKSIIARAKTGTGKTGAFIVPIMEMMSGSRKIEALIIVPTRELASQVSGFAQKVGNHLHIYTTTVYGGASINVQMQSLRSKPNIVVGTPGRLLDLIKHGALELDDIKYLVLDEADIMLDMGFIEDVEEIMSYTPREKQVMLFSATMPKEIVKIAERHSVPGQMTSITVGEVEDLTVSTIKHYYTVVPARLRFSALLAYIKTYSPKKAIIFARTKYQADAIHRVLVSQKYNAILMHGGLTQAMRERSLSGFRGGAQFLIATNVAARGLDIAGVTDVINFSVPEDPNVYVHRVGRSARMGKEGRAMIIAEPLEKRDLQNIMDYANVDMKKIELNLEPFKNLHLPINENGGFKRRGGGFHGHDRRNEHSSRPHGSSNGSTNSSFRGNRHRRDQR
jgi:ATP-dependent RNA helicase DeaD